MPTLLHSLAHAIDFRHEAAFAPELKFLFPVFDTWRGDLGKDEQWMGVMCDHPQHLRASWYDPPSKRIFIRYRVGARHQWLMRQRGQEWALQRTAMLMRLLLKRLRREVSRVSGH